MSAFYLLMYGYMAKPVREVDSLIPDSVLPKLLTASEIRMLKNRWKIIGLLEKGLSIRRIASEVKVGTDTVVRTIRMVEKNNVLQKISRQDSKNIIKSSTSWIFGKNQ